MATRQRTIRADDQLWKQIETCADSLGVSTSQFVRDAALIRVIALTMKEAGPEADLYQQAQRVVVEQLEQRHNHT